MVNNKIMSHPTEDIIMTVLLNCFLLLTMNFLVGVFSLVSAILLILYNYKNIRKQIIEEGGFKKWLKNFTNLKK